MFSAVSRSAFLVWQTQSSVQASATGSPALSAGSRRLFPTNYYFTLFIKYSENQSEEGTRGCHRQQERAARAVTAEDNKEALMLKYVKKPLPGMRRHAGTTEEGAEMSIAKEGDTVRVHYTGKFEDGTVFDTSEDGASMEFKIGDGELLRAFEQGVIGMAVGDSKTVRIPAEEAYGPRKDEMVFEFDRSRAPENFDAEIGQQLQMYRADGKPINITVIGKSDKAFTMDCNHSLAGKNLIFDVRLEEIL
jgi:peptidylprolyl isomerase